MSFSKQTWNQLKGLTVEEIQKALEKDGWVAQTRQGATIPYWKEGRPLPIVIHYHPKKTYGAGLLKGLLEDIGWTEADMKRLKLIK